MRKTNFICGENNSTEMYIIYISILFIFVSLVSFLIFLLLSSLIFLLNISTSAFFIY